MEWIYAMLGLYALLNIGDGLSTYHFVKKEGVEEESNPRARKWFEKIGVVPTILLMKTFPVAVTAGITWLAMHVDSSYNGKTAWALVLAALNAVMAWTIIDNMDWDE